MARCRWSVVDGAPGLVVTPSPGASRDAQPWCRARLHDARERSTGPTPERSLDAHPDPALQECPSDSHFGLRQDSHQLTYGRSDPAAHGDSLNKLMLAGLVGFAPACALAQAQEKTLVGQVQSVDETGTKITLADGTKLLTPLGSVIRPRALQEGTMVVAMYLEENGDKIVTKLFLKQSEPAPSTPSESPKR